MPLSIPQAERASERCAFSTCSEKGRVPAQASRKREVPWLECERLQLESWPPRGRKEASSYTAGQMSQEGPGARAACLEAAWWGTSGPLGAPLPTLRAPRLFCSNYLTLRTPFISLAARL